MICCFSISISLMLLNVGSRPMPGTSCTVIRFSFTCVKARALVRKRIHMCVRFFLFLHWRDRHSHAVQILKTCQLEKKIVAINFRGLASQKIAKSRDLNINTIIKPIILYIWCTVLYLLLYDDDGATPVEEKKMKKEEAAAQGEEKKTHHSCVASV